MFLPYSYSCTYIPPSCTLRRTHQCKNQKGGYTPLGQMEARVNGVSASGGSPAVTGTFWKLLGDGTAQEQHSGNPTSLHIVLGSENGYRDESAAPLAPSTLATLRAVPEYGGLTPHPRTFACAVPAVMNRSAPELRVVTSFLSLTSQIKCHLL